MHKTMQLVNINLSAHVGTKLTLTNMHNLKLHHPFNTYSYKKLPLIPVIAAARLRIWPEQCYRGSPCRPKRAFFAHAARCIPPHYQRSPGGTRAQSIKHNMCTM